MTRSLELAARTSRVVLLPEIGGAIGTFTCNDRPVLRPTPGDAITAEDVRRTACYPLVPYSNRIRDASLTFEGRRYELARNFGDHPHSIHGVGWQRTWTIEASSATHATLSFEHRDDASAWPWSFRAQQSFSLASDDDRHASLIVTLTVENTSDAPFPFGLGWHPFFPRDATTTLEFAAAHVWRNDATQLPIDRIDAEGPWSFDAPHMLGEETIDNVFVDWPGRATLRSPDHGIVTTIEADSACTCLIVYAPAGRDFVAIEPATHETDAFNRAAAGASQTGVRVLAPGGAYSCTMRLTASTEKTK